MSEGRWIAGSARAVGGSRNFKLWKPGTLDDECRWPLLVLLHGCTHDAQNMAEISGMNDVADANGFLVVYPEQPRRANLLKCWNWFRPKHQSRDAGEPSILAAVVGKVCSDYNIDRDRVFVAGVSAGGAMASILGATYPDIFAGIAVFAGAEFKAATTTSEAMAAMKRGGPDPMRQGQLAFEVMRTGLAQKKRRRMPVIVFHGTEDERVNPVNADQTIAQWGKTNACLAEQNGENGFLLTEKVSDSQNGYAYEKHSYLDSDSHLIMEKWLIEGLGHAWSGSPKATNYGDPKGPKASEEIWRFFCESVSHSAVAPPSKSSLRQDLSETSQ